MKIYFLYNEFKKVAVTDLYETVNAYLVPVLNSYEMDIYPKVSFKLEIVEASHNVIVSCGGEL